MSTYGYGLGMAKRTRNPEAKRTALVRAASEVFAAVGFEAASTAAIASSVDVSEGIIYHYFGTKHGLLEACVLDQASVLVDRAMSAPVLDFDALLTTVFSWVQADPMTGRLAAGGDERVMGAFRRGWQQAVVPPLTEALAVEQVGGRCRSGDVAVLARLQFAVVGEAMAMHFGNDPVWVDDLQAVVSEAAQVLRSIIT